MKFKLYAMCRRAAFYSTRFVLYFHLTLRLAYRREHWRRMIYLMTYPLVYFREAREMNHEVSKRKEFRCPSAEAQQSLRSGSAKDQNVTSACYTQNLERDPTASSPPRLLRVSNDPGCPPTQIGADFPCLSWLHVRGACERHGLSTPSMKRAWMLNRERSFQSCFGWLVLLLRSFF